MAALLFSSTRLSATTSTSSRPAPSFLSFPTTPSLITRRRSRALLLASSAPPPAPAPAAAAQPFRALPASETTVLVTGATGYIGRYVVRELLRRGHRVLAVARRSSGIRGRNSPEDVVSDLAPARVVFSDVTDPAALLADLSPHEPIHAAVCCLASRGGGVQDSWRVDYEATLHTLQAARGLGAAHFVLLSAICVQKPLLEFQRAKLKFEEELAGEAARDPAFTYSIVRPTAFFKSLGGQVETVKNGQPYVMFGDGKLCACKPISEDDLAAFIADCIFDEDKANKVLPIGGPGKALTPLEQGEMLFRLLGREPKFIKVPIQIMDGVIWVLDGLAKLFPGLEDAAEFGKIGRYYASESMLLLDPETGDYSDELTPSYGKDTLEQFFERVIREGMAGQELGEQTIF
ncbi:divinyl chlorophyllide a 8-vinyl-reductase, chloroplastic-like [Phragmites australis]|uniref:divinyl chlorophyllide a 8-vinyl-reductase, chloroplastic-like n=1 Tax=Phragmites australis TaxID=29695 RepID=UPI002D76DE80|nr:divinyl chlorophyllide a 8-vinyl-reductase, chloroplastic-like [Phragmites australis]